jgi:hypothetical protein
LKRWAWPTALSTAAAVLLYFGVAAGSRFGLSATGSDGATGGVPAVSFTEIDGAQGTDFVPFGPPFAVESLDEPAAAPRLAAGPGAGSEASSGEETSPRTSRPVSRPEPTVTTPTVTRSEPEPQASDNGARESNPVEPGPGPTRAADPVASNPADGGEAASGAGAGEAGDSQSSAGPNASEPASDGRPSDADSVGVPGSGDESNGAEAETELEATEAIVAPEAALEAFRVALEAEDLDALERIYGGQMPGSDRKMLSQIFDNAGALDVEMQTGELERSDDRAVVEVDYPMSYVLERTGRGQRFTLKLRVELELAPTGWQIVALERR